MDRRAVAFALLLTAVNVVSVVVRTDRVLDRVAASERSVRRALDARAAAVEGHVGLDASTKLLSVNAKLDLILRAQRQLSERLSMMEAVCPSLHR